MVLQLRNAVPDPARLMATKLPRPQLRVKQLVHLLQRPPLQLGHEEDGEDAAQQGVAAEDPPDVGFEVRARRAEEVGYGKGDCECGEDVDKRAKCDSFVCRFFMLALAG
jgi:hypothetical protein